MNDLVQIKATIPRPLKRRAFAALAMREERFNRWLRTQLEVWLQQLEESDRESEDERLVGSQARG
jgi:hypothetical protein